MTTPIISYNSPLFSNKLLAFHLQGTLLALGSSLLAADTSQVTPSSMAYIVPNTFQLLYLWLVKDANSVRVARVGLISSPWLKSSSS